MSGEIACGDRPIGCHGGKEAMPGCRGIEAQSSALGQSLCRTCVSEHTKSSRSQYKRMSPHNQVVKCSDVHLPLINVSGGLSNGFIFPHSTSNSHVVIHFYFSTLLVLYPVLLFLFHFRVCRCF